MIEGEKSVSSERTTTDKSLRTERQKTDKELSSNLGYIKDAADQSVAEARGQADSVLSNAREREDQERASSTSDENAGSLGEERAREDSALAVEHHEADVAANDEGAQRELALASLLAFEREDTDLRLQIERTIADEAVASRDDFLAMVNHDLRSLLGGIALNAAMLMKLATTEEPSTRVARHAAIIQKFSARMNRLIGDLIDVASIDAGRLLVVPAKHDASRLCRDSMEAFQPAALGQGIQLSCQIGKHPIPADFDHERILQVLTNLVGDAIKFTGKDGRITLRVDARGGDVCFAVEDTGEGIPADQLDKIFDRFFQTQRSDQRGLGLGLYISRSIVEAHGGRIWAESTPGRGSTFFFTLPARAEGGPSPRPAGAT